MFLVGMRLIFLLMLAEIKNKNTVLKDEIVKFEAIADDWWNPHGKFKPLHDITPIRLEFITSRVKKYLNLPLQKTSVLDVGCGGGLISEPLARIGCNVTGIDASDININIAKEHAKNLDIHYMKMLVEDLVKEKQKFDLILALEVLEHIDNIEIFIRNCFNLLKPGGLLIFSTMNRTIKSFMQSILIAEYVLKWLPKGTHNWHQFLKPSEINKYAAGRLIEACGLEYSFLNREWRLTNDISNNYFLVYGA